MKGIRRTKSENKGNQFLSEINREILGRINEEILLKAYKLADTLLTSLFRSIFRIQQSIEFTEPEIYQPGDSPDRILWSKVSSYQVRNLALSIAHEEIFAKRFQAEREYEFVILADVSRSMMLKWWRIYGSALIKDKDKTPIQIKDLIASKLYLLKYILTAFLRAAQKNNFTCKVIFFGGGPTPIEFSVKDKSALEKALFIHIDNHFYKLAQNNKPEPPSLPTVLREQIVYQRNRFILCLSDFTDGITFIGKNEPRLEDRQIIPYFIDLAYKYRMVAVRINDKRETEFDPSGHPDEKTADKPFVDVEDDPQIGRNVTVYPKHRDYFIIDARDWYKKLERGFRRAGVIFGSALGGEEVDRMLNYISSLQKRI